MTARDLTPFQDQAGFDIRLEWGPQGLRTLAPVVDTIVDALAGSRPRSAEADAAAATFRHARPNLELRIATSASGRELEADGFGADVALACEHDASQAVPVLTDGAFVAAA